jgi:hypothetical protein
MTTAPRQSTDQVSGYDVEAANNYHAFQTDFTLYGEASEVEAMCADIAFYNKGTSVMWVNGVNYSPGTGISIDCKEGEMNVTRYRIKFTGAGVNQCFVMRKLYVVKK